MSESNINIGPIETVDNSLISSSKEFSLDTISNDSVSKPTGVSVAKSSFSIDYNPPIDSVGRIPDPAEEEPKLLMTIEADIVANTNGNVETKEADSGHPEVARAEPTSPDFVETVQISNADSSIEITSKEMYLEINRSANSQDSAEEETFEVVEVIGMPCKGKKLSTSSETNPLADVNEGNNDDLIAILEGDADSTTAKNSDGGDGETIVFEVIEAEDQKDDIVDPEEVKQIALEQMRNMAKKRPRPPAATGKQQDSGALISSLVSDWSDNEKDNEPSTQSSPAAPAATKKPSLSPPKQSPSLVKKSSPQSPAKKIVVIKKKVQPAKPAPKNVTPTITKPARVIKKKIIWDPDAPETTFSYASLITPKKTPRKPKPPKPTADVATPPAQKRKNEEIVSTPSNKSKPSAPAAPPKPDTPAAEKVKTPVTVKPKPASVVKSKPAAATKSKPESVSKPSPPTRIKTKKATLPPASSASMQPKVRILKRSTPSPIGSAHSKRKRVSEIDRLLNDEGAANMLSTLETEKPDQKDPRARKMATPIPKPSDMSPKKQDSGKKQESAKKQESGKKQETGKKRTGRGRSGGWDYVYNQRNVDSLIIRRRSNSSYSSTTSPRRQSLEAKPLRMIKGKSKSFEFAKPQLKKTAKRSVGNEPETILQDIKKTNQTESGKKSVRTPTQTETKQPPSKTVKTPTSNSREEKATGNITLKKHGNVIQLILKPTTEKIKNCFTVQLMDEIVEHLDILQADSACKVVVLTSSGTSFCQGIDFLEMTQGNLDKRKSAIQQMAASVTSFLKALVNFPKPLVCGVIGPCVNLGLTMLPAFDVVIASDKSSFETTYAKIGQIPEGNCLVSATNTVRHAFKVKLFWLCERLTATEATLSGLVTSLTAPSKVADDALHYAKRLAGLSQQSLVALKTQRPEIKKLTLTLDIEHKILIHQWQTPECQEKFKQFIAKESW